MSSSLPFSFPGRRRWRCLLTAAAAGWLASNPVSHAFADADERPDPVVAASTTPPAQPDPEPEPYDADGHAPIGVIGDHLHAAGEFMLSYRFMPMAMSGLRDGPSDLTDAEALAMDNPFFGNPGQPPKMRILPRDMTMQMHMFGTMYGLTDRITLMAMGMMVGRDMTLETHNLPGASIGTFDTATWGLSGASASALIGLADGNIRTHLLAGVGLPAGSLTETGEALLPNGTRREVRLPYAMQPGSGSFEARPGIVVQSKRERTTLGGQLAARLPLGDNSEGYRTGNAYLLNMWWMVQPTPAVAFSMRFLLERMGAIEGRDPMIAGPVPTADPANYGGGRITGYLGVNVAGQSGVLREHRLALEFGRPFIQDLNGPQMPRDWELIIGWQRSWSLTN